MRISKEQIETIRSIVAQEAGQKARVSLFGSRLDDEARGGDVDLLVEVSHTLDNPALVAARIEARVSRAMGGREVDVVLDAPNLQRTPVHEAAVAKGVQL